MASTTPNMGLRRWDQPADLFSYTELANNWTAVDNHDHTPGKGLQIPTAGIANLAVDSAKLASDAVTTAKIAAAQVTGVKVAGNTLTAANMGRDADTPAAGAFHAQVTGTPTVATGGVVIFDNSNWNTNSWYTITNGRFTPQIRGVYKINAQVKLTSGVTTEFVRCDIYRSGVLHRQGPAIPGNNTGFISCMVHANGTTEYFEVVVVHTLTGAQGIDTGAATFFGGHLIAKRA